MSFPRVWCPWCGQVGRFRDSLVFESDKRYLWLCVDCILDSEVQVPELPTPTLIVGLVPIGSYSAYVIYRLTKRGYF